MKRVYFGFRQSTKHWEFSVFGRIEKQTKNLKRNTKMTIELKGHLDTSKVAEIKAEIEAQISETLALVPEIKDAIRYFVERLKA